MNPKHIIRIFIEKIVRRYNYILIPKKKYEDLEKISKQKTFGSATQDCLFKLLNAYEIDCVFDVGANDGGFAEMLRNEIGYKGWIISFEPLTSLTQTLNNKSIHDEKWEIHTSALGRNVSNLPFHQMAGDVFSSFRLPAPNQPVKYSESNRVIQSTCIQVDTINNVWPSIKKRLNVKSMLLKMDTQGYDLEVFAGSELCQNDIPVVMSEISLIHIYQDTPTYRESLDAYESSGYIPAMLTPISFDDNLAAIEMDLILVKANRTSTI